MIAGILIKLFSADVVMADRRLADKLQILVGKTVGFVHGDGGVSGAKESVADPSGTGLE